MKGKHFRKREKMSVKTRCIILSSIAALELLLLMTSMTFSWFEGLTSLEMNGVDIHTADGLKSHVELGENSSETDTTYNSIIDLTQYFDAQKDVRLSPVSSADAENFYAAYEGTPGATGTKYRKLTQEDINANIIQFEFTLSSPDAPADIFLSAIYPRVYVNGTEKRGTNVTPYRIAFSDGESTKIMCLSALANSSRNYASLEAISSLTNTDTAVTTAGVIENYQNYYYSGSHANPVGPLFQLSKNETKTITCSIWIDFLDPSYSSLINEGDNISFGIRLCSSWSINRTITVYDYTSEQWIDTADENNNDVAMELGVRNLDNSGSEKYFYKFTYDSTNKRWTGNIPIGLDNCEFVWRVAGTTDADHEYANWTAYGRGNNTEITMFGSDDCVWGIGSDDVVRIGLSDRTSSAWLDDEDTNGKAPEMRIQIPYNGASGTALEYSMTYSPETYEGLNTWFAYIPNTVTTVTFNRCERDNNSTIYNQWVAPDRGDETIYYALDGETTVEKLFNDKAIYLRIPDAYASKFFYQDYTPAVSLTSSDNVGKITALNGNLTSLLKSNYYMGAHGDTWIGTGQMTEIEDPDFPSATIYAFYFDEPLTDGTYLTFWNRSQSNNHNNIDNNVSFMPAVQYNSSQGNIVTISEPLALTDTNFSGNYISYDADWRSYYEPVNVAQKANVGQWGLPDNPTIYLNAGATWDNSTDNTWNKDGAIFRAWIYGSTTLADQWIYFTDEDGDGVYEAELPGYDFTNIIFLRAASGSTEWNNEWNRVETTIPTDGKYTFTITGWGSGSWS